MDFQDFKVASLVDAIEGIPMQLDRLKIVPLRRQARRTGFLLEYAGDSLDMSVMLKAQGNPRRQEMRLLFGS